MRENWTKIRLKDHVDLLTGFPFKSGQFSDDLSDIPLVKGDNLHQKFIDWNNAKRWDKTELGKYSKFLLEVGDVVLAMDRPWIEAGLKYAWVKSTDPKALLVQRVARLRGKNGLLTSYLRYLVDHPQFTGYLKSIVTGVNVPHISGDQILNYQTYIPPFPTQHKIVSILSVYDDFIENNNQRIQLLEEMAEEIYKEWFVRMRFPGYQDWTFLDTEGKGVPHDTVGSLPEGWEIKRLRECLSHYIGGGWGEENSNGKHTSPAYVIRGTDIPGFNSGKLNFEVLRYHTDSNLSSRVCQVNDIIFEVSGGTEDQSLGRTCFLSKRTLERFDHPVIAASFCKLLRVDATVISAFYINSLLKRMYSTNELKVFQVQSTGISNYQFEDFIDATKFPIPSSSVQKKFEAIISPMVAEIQLLGAKNQVLQETRDLLLPRLISGKLNVEQIEIA